MGQIARKRRSGSNTKVVRLPSTVAAVTLTKAQIAQIAAACCMEDTFTEPTSDGEGEDVRWVYIENHVSDNGVTWQRSSPGAPMFIEHSALRSANYSGRAGAVYVDCAQDVRVQADVEIDGTGAYQRCGIVVGFGGELQASLYRYPSEGVLIVLEMSGGSNIAVKWWLDGVLQGTLATLAGLSFTLTVTASGGSVGWAVSGDDSASGTISASLSHAAAGIFLYVYDYESGLFWTVDNVTICPV